VTRPSSSHSSHTRTHTPSTIAHPNLPPHAHAYTPRTHINTHTHTHTHCIPLTPLRCLARRFDVVMEMTRATGFLDGLFTPEELDENVVKEKQVRNHS
jgi:hypothetical protein